MFGWVKKRLAREHAKLLFQNVSALEQWKVMSEMNNDADEVRQCELLLAACDMASKLRKGGEIPQPMIDEMLKLNSDLRRHYDATRTPWDEPCEKQFMPILGWKEYYAQLERQ